MLIDQRAAHARGGRAAAVRLRRRRAHAQADVPDRVDHPGPRTADVATIVEENVTGVARGEVVRRRGRSRSTQLAPAARRLRWASIRQIDVRARYAPLMENLPRLGLALVLLYGGCLAIDGEVTVGTLVAFNAYVRACCRRRSGCSASS